MSQIDETSFYCKVANLDLIRKSVELFVFEPAHHWSDEESPICIGQFETGEFSSAVNFEQIGNGTVMFTDIGRDNIPEGDAFWIPAWKYSVAIDQKNPCLTSQLTYEAIKALRGDSKNFTSNEFDWINVKSSTVNFVRYIDLGDMGCSLDIVFLSSPSQCYRYFDVARWVFDEMLASPSPGTFFSEKIKNQPFEKFDFDENDPGPN